MPVDLSIVVPVYNAEGMIGDSVARIVRAMAPVGLNYEILLRDDGSADRSREVLEQTAFEYSQVKCYYNPSNAGLGATLRKLFKDAQGGKIVYCDCDLPFGAGAIPVLLRGLEFSDIVVASRYRGALNKVPFARKVASRLYYCLCRLLFRVPVADIGSGSVAIRRDVLERLDLTSRGFDIHAEFYIKASRQGYRIDEISMAAQAATQGSFRIWRHGPRVMFDTIRLYGQFMNVRQRAKGNG